MVVVLP